MMPSLLGTNVAGIPHAGLSTDAFMNELSRHLVTAKSKRYFRGTSSYGQRTGNAMRINKPSSANNSPQSAMLQARRRTVMGDGLNSRPEMYLPTPAASETYQSPKSNASRRSARPLSWHPGSHHLAHAQAQPQQQPHLQVQHSMFPSYDEPDLGATTLDLPPTPVAYSGLTSPASNYSPLALPCSSLDTRNMFSQGYFAPAQWAMSGQQSMLLLQTASSSSASSSGAPSAMSLPSMSPEYQRSSFDWNAYPIQEFNACTAPATPDNLVTLQQPLDVKLAQEEAIPFDSLDRENDESEGEILYGMGLYDAPERPPSEDAQLRYHRSTVMSLLGAVATVPEPRGRGLKLEDSWEPPASDEEDEEAGDDDDENDADGDY